MGLVLAILYVLQFNGSFPAFNQVHLSYSSLNDGHVNGQAATFQLVLYILHLCVALTSTVHLFSRIYKHAGSRQQIILLFLGRLALQPRDHLDGDDRSKEADLRLQYRSQVNHTHIHAHYSSPRNHAMRVSSISLLRSTRPLTPPSRPLEVYCHRSQG